MDTPWVIGQQGNIDGEYWVGDLAELVVYNRELSESERNAAIRYFGDGIWIADLEEHQIVEVSPEVQAWASLCLVLFNSNEFAYID